MSPSPLREPESVEMQERRYYYVNFRPSFGRSGSAFAIGRDARQDFFVSCILSATEHLRLGVVSSWEEALRVQDWCVKNDNAAKMALIELYEKGNYEPLEQLMKHAKQFGDLPRRKMRATIEVEVEMSGSDAEIQAYLLMHVRGAISIKTATITLAGPSLVEPRPQQV